MDKFYPVSNYLNSNPTKKKNVSECNWTTRKKYTTKITFRGKKKSPNIIDTMQPSKRIPNPTARLKQHPGLL